MFLPSILGGLLAAAVAAKAAPAGADDLADWLGALSSPRAEDRREAEGRLREGLAPEDLPRIAEAIRAGDAEARRRIARALGASPARFRWLMRAFAAGEEPVGSVAEEALRLALQAGTRRVDLPPDEGRAVVLRPLVLEAAYAGAKLSRFLEDLNRFENGGEPVILDPALAASEPVLGVDLRGELPRLLEEIERATGIRWVAFPWFHFLTREPRLAEGGEVFLRLVRSYESRDRAERRAAAVGLALLGGRGVEEALAADAREGGERGEDALAGLCAPCGRWTVSALRSPELLERLVRALSGSDAFLRRGAAQALHALAPSEEAVRAACLSRLPDSAGGERAVLLLVLGRAGADRSLLEGEVHARDPAVAAAAIEALVRAGAPPEGGATSALARKDRTPRLLAAAERALLAARPGVERISALLDSTDPSVRRIARRLLPGSGRAGAARFWVDCARETDPIFLGELAAAARGEADRFGGEDLAAAFGPALAALPTDDPGRLRSFLAAGAAGIELPSPPEDLLAAAYRAMRDPADPLGDLAAAAIGHFEGRGAFLERETAHVRRERLLGEGKEATGKVKARVVAALAAFLRLEKPSGPTGGDLDFVAGALEAGFADREEAEAALRAALDRPIALRARDTLADLLEARERRGGG